MLTRKYRVVLYNDEIVIAGEFPLNSKTYVGNGKEGFEFDTEAEMLTFLAKRGLELPDEN